MHIPPPIVLCQGDKLLINAILDGNYSSMSLLSGLEGMLTADASSVTSRTGYFDELKD